MNASQFPFLKIISAWILAAFGSWGEAAGFLASVYSMVLIGEWLITKVIAVYEWIKARKTS